MKLGDFFKTETIGDFLKHLGIAVGIFLFILITFFYVYLPSTTNHGDQVVVPDLLGVPSDKIEAILTNANLRFEISDSVHSEGYNPLEVIRQFPKAGSIVKPERKIYVSVNSLHPPTVPLPDVVEQSLINASAILKSNGLRPGKIYYMPSPFSDLVLEMQVGGNKMDVGARVNKGTVVDLIVGDGAGPNDLAVTSLVGLELKMALQVLSAYNLHQGNILFPDDVDTTGIETFVYKQQPKAGDSVRVGDPINLWIKPKDYVVLDSIETDNEF